MKKITFLLFVTSILFISCGKSDSENTEVNNKIELSMFYGEWFSVSNSTCYSFVNTKMEGIIYQNMNTMPSIYDNISGSWTFYKENSILRLLVNYNNKMESQTEDYKVNSIDDYSISLKNMDLYNDIVLNKIIATNSMKIGEKYDITYNNSKFESPIYSSLNTSIATVDNTGQVTATGTGITFISIKSQIGTVFVKIEVGSRVDAFAEELFSNIDKILETHGQPDNTAVTESGTKIVAYLKSLSDSSLGYVHYRYDDETREISQILTVYTNESSYKNDESYIKDNNVSISDVVGDVYGKDAALLNNRYSYSMLKDDEGYKILYSNFEYSKKHGRY